MKEKVAGLMNRLENSIAAISIRRGLVMVLPVLMIGSFCLILRNLPISIYQEFIQGFGGGFLNTVLLFAYNATFGMLSVFVTFAVSLSYSRLMPRNRSFTYAEPITALVCFFVLTGVLQDRSAWEGLGVKGMFTAIICGILATKLYDRVYRLRSIERISFSSGADSGFNNAILSILPAAATVILFSIVNVTIVNLFDVSGFHDLFVKAANALFLPLGRTAISGFLFVCCSSVMWFFGIHGSDVLEGMTEMLFTPAQAINVINIQNGGVPTEILCKEFFDVFVLIGGCGTALSLLIAILIFSKSKSNRGLGKLAAFPMIFNINELMVFGFPIIYNPIMLVPFLLTPIASFFISYAAMSSGLVPLITSQVAWTTPIILGGYTATGSVWGSVLQVVNVAVGVAIYRPFVKLYDREKISIAKKNLQSVVDVLKASEESLVPVVLIELPDIQGTIARDLAAELSNALFNDELMLYYQPQFDYDGNCTGVEALLRWKHPIYGMIYPPLVVQLAREVGLIVPLEQFVLRRAVNDGVTLRNKLDMDLEVGINVTANTIQDDDYLGLLEELVMEDVIPKSSICLEITEQTALSSGEDTMALFKHVRQMGYLLAIDDFSMGHTSLLYLQDYHFDLVKLDGSLVKSMRENPRTKDIISSIVQLSSSLGFKVLAEYVETAEQRDDLKRIGCMQYQGYFYSPALPLDELLLLLKR